MSQAEDQEEIRKKRLAKLDRPVVQDPNTASPKPVKLSLSASSTPSSTPSSSISKISITSPQASPASNLASLTIQKTDSNVPLTQAQIEVWIDNLIRSALKITLDNTKAEKDGYLLVEDVDLIEGQGNQFLIPLGSVEGIILTCVSSKHPLYPTPFDHLVNGYRVCQDYKRTLYIKDDRTEAVDKTMSLLTSYAGFFLQSPDNWGFADSSFKPHVVFLQYLEAATESTSFPNQFLNDYAARFEHDGLIDIINPVIEELYQSMSGFSIMDFPAHKYQALARLCSNKIICNLVCSHKRWYQPTISTGKALDHETILGRFMSIAASPEDKTISQCFFKDELNIMKSEVESAHSSLRHTSDQLCGQLHGLTMSILRSTKESHHDAFLNLIGAFLTKGTERLKMNPNMSIVSSDGLMLNICNLMLKLAEPFLDPNSPKMDTVDPEYGSVSKRVDFAGDPKIAASSEESLVWLDRRNPSRIQAFKDYAGVQTTTEKQTDKGAASAKGHPSFITECFFLTHRAMHVGYFGTTKKMATLSRQLEEVQEMIQAEEARGDVGGGLFGAQSGSIHKTIRAKLLINTVLLQSSLLNPTLLQSAMRLYSTTAAWLMKLMSEDPKKPVYSLPLPTPVPMAYATLPTHLVEDMADFIVFLLQSQVDNIMSYPIENILEFFVLMIGSPNQVRNPYIRDKMVTCLRHILPRNESDINPLSSFFDTNRICQEFLVSSLITIYIDIEFTGSHTQFYDKFNTRFSISSIFDYLWSNQNYRNAFGVEFKNDKSKYIKFIALLINDQNYLLDEAISQLNTIRTIELEMEDRQTWDRLPEASRREKSASLTQSGKIAKIYLRLAESTLLLLSHLANLHLEPFMGPEMVDRMAAVLDFYIVKFVGPGVQNLKVKEPERFGFNPRNILTLLSQVYTELVVDSRFLTAVAKDDRSCKPNVFRSATNILRTRHMISLQKIDLFENFIQKVEEELKKKKSEDEELSDAPEEFCDPITACIMQDPVTLPASGVNMDRLSIETHLRNSEKDPFTQTRLTIDMLQPNDELRERIQQWIQSKKAKSS